MTNSADPDQLASSEANWSGSTLFAKTGHVVLSKRRVKSTWKFKAVLKQHNNYCASMHRRCHAGISACGAWTRYWSPKLLIILMPLNFASFSLNFGVPLNIITSVYIMESGFIVIFFFFIQQIAIKGVWRWFVGSFSGPSVGCMLGPAFYTWHLHFFEPCIHCFEGLNIEGHQPPGCCHHDEWLL